MWGNDLALILWVVRVPLGALLVGFTLLVLVPQAQELLADMIESSPWRIALYMVLLFFVWASTTHSAARLLLDTDARFRAYANSRQSPFLDWLETWIPRLLGSLTFVAVLLSAQHYIANLVVIDDPDLVPFIAMRLRLLQLVVAAALVLFVIYVSGRKVVANFAVIRPLDDRARFVARILDWVGLRTPPGSSNLGPLLLVAVFLLCAGIMALDPGSAATWFPRGLAIPVLAGAWVPFLSLLSALGRQYRAPLIAALAIGAAVVLPALFGDNHAVRRIDATATVGKAAKAGLSLNDAVHSWMEINDCTADPGDCPRPIIVAAAGGASRGGFFMASTIGYFLDPPERHDPRIDALAVRNRLFAISGVSGGAVGAVMTVAAIASADATMKQPCAQPKPALWYGRFIANWRDCLEALMAGDFLTADMFGLVFRDNLQFGGWADRATLLEQSWEHRFAEVMKSGDDWPAKCPRDLRCPFLTATPQLGQWLPLLVLNGVSAQTGRRIITTPLALDYNPHGDCPFRRPRMDALFDSPLSTVQPVGCPLFIESVTFHDLLWNRIEPDWIGRLQRLLVWDYIREQLPSLFAPRMLDDVRLSTAAHNSARFPIISPPGSIRNRTHRIVDYIVDGGYKENYGALGAIELVQAIRAVEPRLAPFVLILSNDPLEDPTVKLPQQQHIVLLPDLAIPLEALGSNRVAESRLALAHLEQQLETIMPGCGANYSHIHVWPQFEPDGRLNDVSGTAINWWLSRAMQVYLHQQLEEAKSGNQNQNDIENAWRALSMTSRCAEQ
jgi:hypothetical protein